MYVMYGIICVCKFNYSIPIIHSTSIYKLCNVSPLRSVQHGDMYMYICSEVWELFSYWECFFLLMWEGHSYLSLRRVVYIWNFARRWWFNCPSCWANTQTHTHIQYSTSWAHSGELFQQKIVNILYKKLNILDVFCPLDAAMKNILRSAV